MSDAPSAAPAEMPADTPVKRKSPLKTIAATAAIAFLLGGVAGGYLSMKTLGSALSQAASEENAKNDGELRIEGHGDSSIIQVSRIALTLNPDMNGNTRSFLVTPVIVVHPDSKTLPGGHDDIEDALSAKVPALRDSFIEYLSQLEPREAAGSAGMSIIRAELKRRAEAVLEGYEIEQVLFNDYVIQ